MTTRKKTVVTGVSVLAAGLLGLGVAYRPEIQLLLLTLRVSPGHTFTDVPPPAPPDYANEDHWAALPNRIDDADTVPIGATDLQATAPADVFFVHPTTFLSADAWNQALDDDVTNQVTNEMVMRGQASVFNKCCRVYAPRYRQATLAAFFTEGESGPQALSLAYEDVVTAFRYFVAHFNQDRPFILASHSQGSQHLNLLLAQEIAGTPLGNRMVAAYPVGFDIDGSNGIPVCETPTQTGCQVSWNTVGPDAGPLFASASNICVNPLSWRADDALANHEKNLGAVNFAGGDTHEPGAADGQCRDGRLYVSEIHSDRYSTMPLGRDNYHVYDYALFYVNLRQNAQARVDAFLRNGALTAGC